MKKALLITASIIFGLLAVGFLLTFAARAQDTVNVNVTETEFKINLSQTTFPVNTPIKFTITNQGVITHEVVLEKAGDVDKALEINGVTMEADDIKPGETRTVVWTIPDAGKYQLACHIPGHFQGGMFTTIDVTAASGGLFNRPLTWIIVGGILLILLAAGIIAMLRGKPAAPNQIPTS